jgi:hypothetical protein
MTSVGAGGGTLDAPAPRGRPSGNGSDASPGRRQLFALAAVLAAATLTGALAIDGLRHPAPARPVVVIVQTTPAQPPPAEREGGD